ncbi:hypothetical protein LTR94_038320, partial [Friedmanniomyces endolithicus]
QAGAPASEGSRRKGEDRAVVGAVNRGQPALHHRRPERPEASGQDDHPRRSGAAGRGPHQADAGAL